MATAAELQELNRLMQEYVRSQTRLTEENRRLHTSTQLVNDEMEIYEHQLGDSNKLSKQQHDLYRKAYDAKKKELTLAAKIAQQENYRSKIQDEINAAQAAGVTVTQEMYDNLSRSNRLIDVLDQQKLQAHTNSEKANKKYVSSISGIPGIIGKFSHSLSNTGGVLGKFGSTIGGSISWLSIFSGTLGLVASQMLKGLDQYRISLANNSGVIEGSSVEDGIDQQLRLAAVTGLSNDQMSKLVGETRQTINAMGGTKDAFNLTRDAANEFYALTGSKEKGERQAMLATQNFMRLGVKPATHSLAQFTKDMKSQAKINGMSLEQSMEMYNAVATDADSITLLKAAREGERESILANQRALIRHNQTLGMSAEQAAEAAKMLNKMVAAKPLDRLKQAAKMEALGGAMGHGAEAHAAAEAVRKGKRATSQDKENLNTFNTLMTNTMDTMAQQGLGSELVGQALLDKTGLDQLFGPASPFSTTLTTAMAVPMEHLDKTFSEYKDSVLTSALSIHDLVKNAAEGIQNGSAALELAVLSLDKTILDSNSWAASADRFVNWLPVMGENIMLAWQRLVDVIVAPIQAIGAGLEFMFGHLAKVIEKVSGFFGFDSVERQAEKAANEHYSVAERLISAMFSSWKPAAEPEKQTPPPTPPLAPINKEQQKPEQTVDKNKEQLAKDSTIQMANNSSALLEMSKRHSTTIETQLTKMDESTGYLKIIANTIPILTDLAEKQLAALTMSEEQKRKYATNLRSSDSKFAAEYATLG